MAKLSACAEGAADSGTDIDGNMTLIESGLGICCKKISLSGQIEHNKPESQEMLPAKRVQPE